MTEPTTIGYLHGRPPGEVTMDAAGKCAFRRRPMVRVGPFWDCEACGRTVHVDEVEAHG